MTPFRDLPQEQQDSLREDYSAEMARQATTCSLDEKIARFAAWLAPRGISFGPEDIPRGRRDAAPPRP